MNARARPDSWRSPDLVHSIARAFSILRAFRRGERALGNKEIARRTGLPKSTVARLTHTLARLGYLEHLVEEEKYALGIGVLALGQRFLSGLDVREAARAPMQELAERSQATVALAARDDVNMVFLEICHGNPLFRSRLEVGERVPRGTTALGRAAFAGMAPEVRERAMQTYRSVVRKADWPPIRDGLERAVRDHQRYGFCFSLGDWNPGLFAVGVPMVSRDGRQVMAFSCFGQAHEMTRARIVNDLGPRLVELRDRVRSSLGEF